MWKALFALFVALLAGCASAGLPQPIIEKHEDAPRSATQTGLLVGTVVGVTDGDTITVLDDQRNKHKIRLASIDAPEKSQPFAKRSKEHLSSLVFGRRVTVETEKQDRYGRTVGKVIIDGLDVNLAQVVAGMAWHYKKYEGEQSRTDRLLYAAAQRVAENDRLGLWSSQNAIPPWAFRLLSQPVNNAPLALEKIAPKVAPCSNKTAHPY